MSKSLKSILYQILGILVVAIIIWGGVKYKSSLPFLNDKQEKTTANKPRPPTPIDSSKVRVGQIQATLEAVGNVRALESIKITSEVSGIISSVNFKEGVNVKKGQILIYLESTEQKAEVDRWKAILERRKRLVKSGTKLAESKNIPLTKLDQLNTDVAEATAELKIATVKLNKRFIKAPFSGRVGLRNISAGAYIEPGDTIATLDSINPINLDFEVPESAIGKIAIGNNVKCFSRAYPNKAFEGTIKTIDTRVKPASRAITVRATIPNEENLLKPGMFMIVDLPVEQRTGSIIVPEAAIRTSGTERSVYIVIDGKAKLKKVELGQRLVGEVEILSGIDEESIVVVGGHQKIRDNSPVLIRNVE